MLIIWFWFEQYVTRKSSSPCNLPSIHTPLFVLKCDQKTFTFLPTIQEEENKKIIVKHYSEGRNCCNCPNCNESNIEFLAVDHIEGGGGQHRKQISGNFYNYLIKQNFPEGYQILCHNCNHAKRDKGYCPVHETKLENI